MMAINDPNIYPKPAPPNLPAAGSTALDPTFGTQITRVTDPSTALTGAGVNSASLDSMFNADGSRFYLHRLTEGPSLYSVAPTTGQVTLLGLLPSNLSYDGAAWDPTNPSVLYAMLPSTTNRQLWQITLPLPGTLLLLHDFSQEIPPGGYPSSRVQVSPDGRYFAVTASSVLGGGQDSLDYVVVWDRVTNTSKILNVQTRLGVYLHNMELDGAGGYVVLGPSTGSCVGGVFLWNWPSDTLSTCLVAGSPDFWGGHYALTGGEAWNPDIFTGKDWMVRSLATPHAPSVAFSLPLKNGKVDWFEDNHSTRVGANGIFTSTFIGSFAWGTFVSHAGSIYKLVGYRALSIDVDIPQVFRYKGKNIPLVSSIPTASNQWWYDSLADTLYVWLPDNSSPESNRSAISIVDWRPLMEEIVELVPSTPGSSTLSWLRLAHHRMHWDGTFETSPRVNAAPTSFFALFQSNWDGSPRTDVFLLLVP